MCIQEIRNCQIVANVSCSNFAVLPKSCFLNSNCSGETRFLFSLCHSLCIFCSPIKGYPACFHFLAFKNRTKENPQKTKLL